MSYNWTGIHEAKYLVRRGTRWKIGEGDTVHLRGNPWINDDRSLRVHAPVVTNFEDMVIRDFYIPNTRCWDVELISEVFSGANAARILKTILAPNGVQDTLIWHYAPNDKYNEQ